MKPSCSVKVTYESLLVDEGYLKLIAREFPIAMDETMWGTFIVTVSPYTTDICVSKGSVRTYSVPIIPMLHKVMSIEP